MEEIFLRRSIRKYSSAELSHEQVTALLKAAMAAPSAGNEQAWQFLVINDRTKLQKIPSVHPYSAMILEVSCAIMVCGDLEKEMHKGFWVQDCSAATQNILLEAHSLGLGTVWLGVYPKEDRVQGLRNLFGIPENITPFSLIPVGYPAERKDIAERYSESKVHYNVW